MKYLSVHTAKNLHPKIQIDKTVANKYQYDFQYLVGLVETTLPKLDSIFPKAERELLIEATNKRLGEEDVNDLIFTVRSIEFLSKFNNQHTNIGMAYNPESIFPFVVFNSNNEWFLQNVDKKIDSLNIGEKVVQINNIPILSFINFLKKISLGENDVSKEGFIYFYSLYMFPQILREFGIIDAVDSIKISLASNKFFYLKNTQIKDVNFYKVKRKANPISKHSGKTYSYSFIEKTAYLQYNSCMDKPSMLDGLGDYVKPMFLPFAKMFLKAQYKENANLEKLEKGENTNTLREGINLEYPAFKDILNELFTKLKENKTEKLIIDLRNNSGGSGDICNQLLYYLADTQNLILFDELVYTTKAYKYYFSRDYSYFEKEYIKLNGKKPKSDQLYMNKFNRFDLITDPKSPYYIHPDRPIFNGKVIVLANQNTGSAAALLTALIQDNKLGVIVGTSVGNNPTGPTTLTSFSLPNTKLEVSVSSSFLERPDKRAGYILIPDYWIEPSLFDFINGIDPLLSKALEL